MFISSFHIYDLFSGSVVLVVIFLIVVVIIVVMATNVVVVAVFVTAVDELAFSRGLYNTNRATEITVARVVVVVVIVVVVVVTVIVALFFGTSGVIYASILTAVAILALYI